MLKSIFLGLLLLCFIQKGFGEEVESYEDALKVSKETNKEILLYFGADWCGYCKKMETTLKDKEVSEKIDNFVVLKVNIDQNKELAKKYNVKSIPDYMVIDKDSNITKRHKGYKSKEDFFIWLSP